MSDIEIIADLVKDLPETIAAIGYGSGFYKQKGYTQNDKPDKDIILIVDNLYRFLSANYFKNPDHFYKGADRKYKEIKDKKVKYFYHKLGCLKFQKGNYRFKILAIEKDALLYDIMSWKYFGIAARFTKPIIYENIPEDIEKAIEYDREAALIAALLSIPDEKISKPELYKTISGFSYLGDWRMITHSEKRTKASDIVDGAFYKFDNMYGQNPLIDSYCNQDMIQNEHLVELIDYLPESLKNYIIKNIDLTNFDNHDKEDLRQLSEVIKNYFLITNMINTPLLMYSCFKSLGATKTLGHARLKRKNAKGW